MKKLIYGTILALGAALALVVPTSSPASATDGPWAYVSGDFVQGRTSTGKAKYYGDTDVLKLCTGGSFPINGKVKWRTATLSGSHWRSVYDGGGCSTFNHKFKRGTRVDYQVCIGIQGHKKCSLWKHGWSTY